MPPTNTEVSAAELDGSIQSFIASSNPTEAEFERLALALFAFQYANNVPYRMLCDQRNHAPSNVTSWRDVPALSTSSFADARIACFPPSRTTVTFVSSGTTRGGAAPSIHELENTRLYDASLLRHFRSCVLPDRDEIRMLLLSPSFEQAPHSSLAYMLSKVFATFGKGGGFFIRDGVLEVAELTRSLRESREPVLIFGTAFAYVHFLDACAANGDRFTLPPGSRVVETGGFKGKSREVSREEFYESLATVFGVPPPCCISEYGMCELGSQWYDASLCDVLSGRTPREALKLGPHWARTRIVDPVTTEELAPGKQGLLQIFDLSNRGSVAAVLTGDLAVERDGGFRWIGRTSAAPPKGCSIAVDSMLEPRA